MSSNNDTTTAYQSILNRINTMISEAIPNSEGPPDPNLPFLEMGANSLVLMDVQRSIKSEFEVELSIGQFFEELTNIDALVHFLAENSVSTPPNTPEPTTNGVHTQSQNTPIQQISPVQIPQIDFNQVQSSTPTINLPQSEIEAIFSAQLRATSKAINELIQQQLVWLSGQSGSTVSASGTVNTPQSSPEVVSKATPSAETQKSQPKARPGSAIQPQKMLSALETRARGLSPTQQSHLERLIKEYNKKTAKSKAQTQQYRPVLADSRAAIGFRFTTKEMLYPIVSDKSRGARIWDIDGNEYIDISMGQGVSLFGHHPEFIEKELRRMVNEGVEMGPRPDNVGEVAQMICDITGFDRVTFTNSGTEAVMAVMRLARAATKRDKIVSFEGAWHGHSDSVMGMRVEEIDGVLQTKPVSPGTPMGAVADHWVLPFDDPESLEFIRKHASSIAAVLVEPVQSRNPRVQPKEFLHELRKITKETGSLLIFDEMITGFRMHLGGAQHWFGVKADMATYGKVIGGGLPIGVVAGRSDLMDPIDGGMWQYGDTSYPVVSRVVFGGTFCQHPLAMTASLATLRHLVDKSPKLQEELNALTEYLATTLNTWFDAEEVPIQVAHFGSLFRFEFNTNLELLFYHMNLRGVFVWEWRNCFLSTAHTKQDIDHVIEVVKESVLAMRDGGFIPPKQADASQNGSGSSDASRSKSATKLVPMTQSQRQLATLAEIQPAGSLAYHVNATLEIDGDVDIAVMTNAIEVLSKRHDALRTTLENRETLKIAPSLSGFFSWMDVSTQKNPAQFYSEWHKNESEKPFDPKKGPLVVFSLTKLAENKFKLWIKAHHIIIDGLSMNLLVSELAEVYSSLSKGQQASSQEKTSFIKHSEWLNGQEFSKQSTYWQNQFQDGFSGLDIPVEKTVPPVKTYAGHRITRTLQSDLVNEIKTFSTKNLATDFMCWFSLYTLWLHRVSGQNEVIVGMPVAGRSFPDSDDVIGYMTHLIPVKSTLESADESFKEYLKRIRSKLLRGYENQDYPFSRLLDFVNSKPGSAGKSLVNAVFNIDRPGAVPEFNGLSVAWASQPIYRTAFDVTLNLTEVNNSLTLECDFNLEKFTESRMNQYLDAFIDMARNAITGADTPAMMLPMLNTDSYSAWFKAWNSTDHDLEHGNVITNWLHTSLSKNQKETALEWDSDGSDHKMTFSDLETAIQIRSAYLQQLGIKKGDRIAISLKRTPDLVITLLAALNCGAVYIPIDADYPAGRISYMVQDGQAKLLIADPSVLKNLELDAKASHQVKSIDEIRTEESVSKSSFKEVELTGSDLAYIMYTSGSTGEPKGAMITHKGLSNYLHWAAEYYQTEKGDGVLLHSSISFDATLTSLFSPLLAGKTLVLVPEATSGLSNLMDYLTGSKKKDWSFLKITTSHLDLLSAMIPDEKKKDITRCLILGGEALFGHNIQPWQTHAPKTRIVNEYGPTETVVGCCIYEADSKKAYHGAIPIGKPIWNTTLLVLDAHGNPVAPGMEGELYIGGLGVGVGYWNRDALSNEKFRSDIETPISNSDYLVFYRSGDKVRLIDNGELEFIGRADNQVKLNGYRIEPGEIEAEIKKVAGVDRAAVILHANGHETRLISVVKSSDKALTADALRVSLTEKLPGYMIPGQILFLDDFPLTPNGKLDVQNILGSIDQEADASPSDNNTSDEVTQKIRAIWTRFLGHSTFTNQSNFFEIGGHSMMVLPMKDELGATFGKEVTPGDIFRFPTVKLLATWLGGNDGSTPSDTVDSTSSPARKQRNRPNFRPISKTSS
jgi:amino acid adenylation domain-containing protein